MTAKTLIEKNNNVKPHAQKYCFKYNYMIELRNYVYKCYQYASFNNVYAFGKCFPRFKLSCKSMIIFKRRRVKYRTKKSSNCSYQAEFCFFAAMFWGPPWRRGTLFWISDSSQRIWLDWWRCYCTPRTGPHTGGLWGNTEPTRSVTLIPRLAVIIVYTYM